MSARWIAVLVLLCGICANVRAQETGFASDLPPARIAAPTLAIPTSETPTLLAVPALRPALQQPCPSCPTEYNPNHVYLPEQCPDGGCDGDCQPCRQWWADVALFVGKGDNLRIIDRNYIFGFWGNGGYWFGPERQVGVHASLWFANGTYSTVSAPLTIDSPMTLGAGDVNLRLAWLDYERVRIDALVGYRYASFREELNVSVLGVPFDLEARNTINAGQIGLVLDYRYGPYFTELLGKFAVGENSNSIRRIGVGSDGSDLCVIPEFAARVGYQIGESLWCTLGYNIIYLSNVQRPTLPGSDYVLHGLTVGCLKRF